MIIRILGFLCLLAPGVSFGQIDTTPATDAVADAAAAISTVIGALIAAYFGFLGYRMLLTAVKRENYDGGPDAWDADSYYDEHGRLVDPDDPEWLDPNDIENYKEY